MPTKQHPEVFLQWGWHGAESAAADILIVVDVLSFSTAVIAATRQKAQVYPVPSVDDANALSVQIGGVAAVRRQSVPTEGIYSLSPATLSVAPAGTKIVLPSPNSATCVWYGKKSPALFIGALTNARAVAGRAAEEHARTGTKITVLACGERFPSPTPDGTLRFAVEDYLGAGAILSHLPASLTRTPEAAVCEAAFQEISLPNVLFAHLLNCESGGELTERGYEGDVRFAAELNTCETVPMLMEETYFA